jgi:glutamyl-tRNA(Gln) amidotransferase subunit D
MENQRDYMSYKGVCKEFLDSCGISFGDIVIITKKSVEYKGMVLNRAIGVDDKHLVLKLDNGYNVGVDVTDARVKLLEKGEKPKIELPILDVKNDPDKQNISIISTGGTVASIIDYKTGAVHPAFTADDLLRANPELMEQANINGKAILNILSENMKPEYWIKTALNIVDEVNNGVDGVIVAHGTDTMHYTSAALSFMLNTPVPIILTGAQRSSDRPSSDAFLNLMASVTAAKSDIAEVLVCMHSNMNDDYTYLHRGTKVRKMHTSRRDTFRSVNTKPLAKIENGNLEILDETMDYSRRSQNEIKIYDTLEEDVALIKSYPGISGNIIDYYVDKGFKGLVLEGTGLGHCPEELIPSLQRANDNEIPVVMTSQCLYGRVNMNVYSTGRKLLDSGVFSALDMLPETAYVKLIWTLGQTEDLNEVRNIMQTNLKGEIRFKTSQEYFLI